MNRKKLSRRAPGNRELRQELFAVSAQAAMAKDEQAQTAQMATANAPETNITSSSLGHGLCPSSRYRIGLLIEMMGQVNVPNGPSAMSRYRCRWKASPGTGKQISNR